VPLLLIKKSIRAPVADKMYKASKFGTNFYAYMWLRENGTPYYIGKGKGDRAFHKSEHIVKPPIDKSRILIFARASEQEAFETEKELIRNWGRKDLGTGCLRNMTDGGDGPSGFVRTAEMNRKVSESRMGQGKGHIPWNKGKTGFDACSAETRKHLSDLRAGVPLSEFHRHQIGKSLKNRVMPWGPSHIRWHVNRSIVNPNCRFCVKK